MIYTFSAFRYVFVPFFCMNGSFNPNFSIQACQVLLYRIASVLRSFSGRPRPPPMSLNKLRGPLPQCGTWIFYLLSHSKVKVEYLGYMNDGWVNYKPLQVNSTVARKRRVACSATSPCCQQKNSGGSIEGGGGQGQFSSPFSKTTFSQQKMSKCRYLTHLACQAPVFVYFFQSDTPF